MAVVVVLVLAGIFSIVCAIKDFDWFMENRKTWIFRKMFGRKGARIFYVILGVFVIVCAVLAYMNGQVDTTALF